jgi:hypothetical protein
MGRQILGLILAFIVLVFLIYVYLFYNDDRNEANKIVMNSNSNQIGKISANNSEFHISIKQIDSLTAERNLYFTIRNAVGYKKLLEEEETVSN